MKVSVEIVVAETFRGAYQTFSKPVVLECSDGRDYVVKGRFVQERLRIRSIPRAMFTEQVVGRLGGAMGAPVGRVVLVDLPEHLLRDDARLVHLRPGIAHGSELLDSVHDNYVIEQPALNRSRLALLALLFGWFEASDQQYLFDDDPPFRIYSVDHGHFLPGGPDWTTVSLRRASVPEADVQVLGSAALGPDIGPDLIAASERLRGIDDAEIVRAVAAPPDTWTVSVPERMELAKFLSRRRDQLVAMFAQGANASRARH